MRRPRQNQLRLDIFRALIAAAIALLSACSDLAPAPTADPTPTPPVPPTDLPPAADTAFAFAAAIDAQDYTAAFALLDAASQGRLGDATALWSAYAAAHDTATALTVTVHLRSSLLTRDAGAVTSLESVWHTERLDTFTLTTPLDLVFEAGQWRVSWTSDAIVPGLDGGRLLLQRQPATRGAIRAADGRVLAAQVERVTIGVRPGAIQDAAQETAMLDGLSQITGLAGDDIKARYASAPADWFVPIADLDDETFTNRSTLIAPYPAVIARRTWGRAYHDTTLAPHVVGYVGAIPAESVDEYRALGYTGDEQVGLSGVEGGMEAALAGQAGQSLIVVRADGSVATVAERPYQRGRDVTLTLSPTLQTRVQDILGRRPGAAVVLDAQDGSVLAMVSYPTFDTAVFSAQSRQQDRVALITDTARPLVNRATQAGYPPGSTFKIVTMAAGMAEGVAQPGTIYNDPGYWEGLGKDYRKTCWLATGHGRISLQNGLTASCNVVFYEVGKQLDEKGQELLPQHAREFGFGAPTGVELSSEYAGVVPDPAWKRTTHGEVWTSGDTVNLAVGQGFMLATPLQITQMTAAIAAGGVIRRPRIVAETGGNDDLPAQAVASEVTGRLSISPAQLAAIQQAMVGVTINGRYGTTTARFAGFDAYRYQGLVVAGSSLTSRQRSSASRVVVAGKSGTAQAPGLNDKPFAWFTAYVPADDPQIVVTVLLENAGEGSTVAAPLARQVIEAYFGLPLSRETGDSNTPTSTPSD